MLVSVMVFPFCFQVLIWMPFSQMGAQLLGFASTQPFRVYPWKACVPPGAGPWPTPGVHWIPAPSTALSRDSLLLLSQLPSRHLINMVWHTALKGSPGSHSIPLTSLHDGEWFSLPGFVLPNDTVDSKYVVGIKPGQSSMVIGYQVDEFTHYWSM